MALYDQVVVEVNGGLLVENSEVETEFAEDIVQIKAIVGGFRGISPGVPVRMVKIKSFVPIAGPEFDFERAMALHEPLELRLSLTGGRSVLMHEAYVIGPSTLTTGVGKATEADITLVGAGEPFSL